MKTIILVKILALLCLLSNSAYSHGNHKHNHAHHHDHKHHGDHIHEH